MPGLKDNLRATFLRLLPLLAPRPTGGSTTVERLLLIRPDHLGDVLFTTPALRLLRSSLPEAHITVLVGPWARPILENNRNVDEIITCDFPWFNRRRKSSLIEPYAILMELARSLRGGAYDAAIDLRFDFWWGALAAYLAGIPWRVGYDVASCDPFLTHRIGYVQGKHEVEQNANLIEHFLALAITGLAPSVPGLVSGAEWASPPTPPLADRDVRHYSTGFSGCGPIEFAVGPADDGFASNYLARRGVNLTDRLVALQPGSGSPRKQWDADRFALVGSKLAQDFGCTLIVTGGAADRGIANAIAAGIGNKAIAAAGDTTLGQLGALLKRCDLAIGVDSGGMHLAVAVGTPTVHLFGPSDDHLFGPFGDVEKHRVVRAGQPCSPCGKFDFTPAIGPGDCMMAITVDQVIGEALGLLAEGARDSHADTRAALSDSDL